MFLTLPGKGAVHKDYSSQNEGQGEIKLHYNIYMHRVQQTN